MTVSAEQVLKVARDHIGATKYGSIHKALVDRYNQERPLPLGYTLKYDDDWCDAFVTTVGILANATHLIGQECGCERHIEIFKQKGIWIEDGSVTPQAGWIIVWNWDDVTQPNDGFADHIGFVESVKNGIITTIEGNTFIGGVSQVGRNQFKVGDGRIRGYAKPKYGAASSVPIANPAPSAEQEVKKHIICTISELRVFDKPSGTATIVDTITSGQVKNIDKVFRDGQYLWGSYISYAGDRRYTTLETSDGTRKFVDIKEGYIDHATYKVEEDTVKVSDTQKVGGQRSVDLKSNEFELGGVVYVVTKK
ncbi:CHAP domain-containing protein [Aerococcaceae bacterium NML190938]|nr:CHAP domain-containing protein [Aerococcaceae bacterium NML190938]